VVLFGVGMDEVRVLGTSMFLFLFFFVVLR
jgi:hypothetical protein